MSHDATQNTDRRTFLQAGALATASALTLANGTQAADPKVLPKRKLGKTGVEITMLEMGSGALRDRSALDRLIRLSFAEGVRTFDTAKLYGSEPNYKRWFEQSPEVRKQIVLITKDNPKKPSDLPGMVDQRLAALNTDSVDLFYVHAVGDSDSVADPVRFVRSPQFGRAIEAILTTLQVGAKT